MRVCFRNATFRRATGISSDGLPWRRSGYLARTLLSYRHSRCLSPGSPIVVKTVVPNQHFMDGLVDMPLFRGLDSAQRNTLIQCARVVAAEPGEYLFREGEPAEGFFIIKTGRVKMRRITNAGREVVLHLSSPPQMIGCKGLTLPGSRYPADAVAVDAVIALRFVRELFLEQVGEVPDVLFSLLVNLNRRLLEIYTLQSAILEPTEQRVATLLLNQAMPEGWEEGRDLDQKPRPVRITKSLIAAIVGTTTETAIRLLSTWKKKGFIRSERGKIDILSVEAISRIAGGSKAGELTCEPEICRTCPLY